MDGGRGGDVIVEVVMVVNVFALFLILWECFQSFPVMFAADFW